MAAKHGQCWIGDIMTELTMYVPKLGFKIEPKLVSVCSTSVGLSPKKNRFGLIDIEFLTTY